MAIQVETPNGAEEKIVYCDREKERFTSSSIWPKRAKKVCEC